MSIHVALNHRTEYHYDRPVQLSPQIIRLRPAPHCRTRILSYSQKVSPDGFFINWQQDPHANYAARIVYPERINSFVVEIDLVAEMAVYNPFDFFVEHSAEFYPFTYAAELTEDLRPYLRSACKTPEFEDYLEQIRPRKKINLVDFLVSLNSKLENDIRYLIRLEPGVQSPGETLQLRSGSCRDSAWLMVELCRRLGIAARFVSGYLIQLTPDVKSLDGPSGTDKDFTDLHAWTEVFIPGAGWIGLDPTSGLLAGEGHIPLACTPVPSSAAPITGDLEFAEVRFEHHMSVQRIHESARVTKPYTGQQWQAIDALGEAIDAKLKAADVRLTMGGEPTFISIDDMDGAEWNVTAVGPHKRKLSETLLRRLWLKYAKGGFLHYGQGKWYPGESLPRWAFAAYWRKDGEPIWQDARWLAEIEKDYGYTIADAQKFSEALGLTLGVDVSFLEPAFEDAWYYLWKEQKLPTNVDPLDSKLKDPEERERLSRIFKRGLDEPTGYVLPLQRQWQAKAGAGWISGPMFMRQGRVFLSPGDSPVGLRLPIDSMPWVRSTDYPYVTNPDPTVGQPSLPKRVELAQQYHMRVNAYLEQLRTQQKRAGEFGPVRQVAPAPAEAHRPPGKGESANWVVRTALCIEPRAGKLFIFIPPVAKVEDYLDLIAAIEETAAKLQMPVILEGEAPPADARLNVLKITPDPGVIEVNIHPSEDWKGMVEKTTTLYEEARLTRLCSEKFMIDGRHVGTGGGNHLVLGGKSPADSPFLRRPDLLRSLLIYWQRHPSLSYFFSGLFIGPTSQSPRIDEARMDSLYELEIAFREVDLQLQKSGTCAPWLVDRIFRNLLTDLTGNTHRAEFCIDKLYSPDSSSGRLGLLELRSFEMPPHAHMSLAQQLLMRALICWFWHHPLSVSKLNRWGTDLHDRFMLPEFQWRDLREVLADLRQAGFAFADDWFEPHFEFRFPRYGNFTYGDIDFELRLALEPWHVLGEQGAAGSTVRFVDSSVERLQVKLSGVQGDRYQLAVNKFLVPLTETGRVGEKIAGVRYRAWQPPNCLHPTLGVHTPLVFDLVDTWNNRAVAGCTYHVGHPGGRNYTTLPVNSYEAESRRLARFENMGHSPGHPLDLKFTSRSNEFPVTLDLRLY